MALVILAYLQIFTGNPSYHYLLWWYRFSFVLNPAILVFAFCAKPRGKKVDVDGKGSVAHKPQGDDDQAGVVVVTRL